MLNDEFVVGHVGLVPAHLPRSHSRSSACARLVCFRSMQCLKINIFQGSAVTLFRCGDVCNNLYCKFPAECNSERIFEKWSYFVEISTRVYPPCAFLPSRQYVSARHFTQNYLCINNDLDFCFIGYLISLVCFQTYMY